MSIAAPERLDGCSRRSIMGRNRSLGWMLVLVLGVNLGVADVRAQSAQQAPAQARKATPASKPAKQTKGTPAPQKTIEPKAIEILKASSNRLAAAQTMAFTAVVSYESSSRYGPPLIFTTKSDVTMQRPDKLRVITLGDGPASEFYYNGKTMMAYSPAENLVAVADGPAHDRRGAQVRLSVGRDLLSRSAT